MGDLSSSCSVQHGFGHHLWLIIAERQIQLILASLYAAAAAAPAGVQLCPNNAHKNCVPHHFATTFILDFVLRRLNFPSSLVMLPFLQKAACSCRGRTMKEASCSSNDFFKPFSHQHRYISLSHVGVQHCLHHATQSHDYSMIPFQVALFIITSSRGLITWSQSKTTYFKHYAPKIITIKISTFSMY